MNGPQIKLPPPVISNCRVLAYAVVDESVHWVDRQLLFRGDKSLGRVPRLAIGENIPNRIRDEVHIFHCDEHWEVLFDLEQESLEKAKARMERDYHGISEKWINANFSTEEVDAWIKEDEAQTIAEIGGLNCALCGRSYLDVDKMVSGKNGFVCGKCIEEAHALISASDKGDAA